MQQNSQKSRIINLREIANAKIKTQSDSSSNVHALGLGAAFKSEEMPVIQEYERTNLQNLQPIEKVVNYVPEEINEYQEFHYQSTQEFEDQRELREKQELIELLEKEKAEKEAARIYEQSLKQQILQQEKERILLERQQQKQAALQAKMEQRRVEEERKQAEYLAKQQQRIEEERHKQAIKLEKERLAQEKLITQQENKQKEKEEKAYKEFLAQQEKELAKREKIEARLAKKREKQNRKEAKLNKRYNSAKFGWFTFTDLLDASKLMWTFDVRKTAFSFVITSVLIVVGIGGIAYAKKGLFVGGKVLGVSKDGYDNLNNAVSDLASKNFQGSATDFTLAYENFSQAANDINGLGGILIDATRYIPFASKASSGKNAVEAGQHFSLAGKEINTVIEKIYLIKQNSKGLADFSILNSYIEIESHMQTVKKELDIASENISKVNIADLPEDKRDKFILLKEKLPIILEAFDQFSNNTHIIVDLLGGNGPRKYLFLFQNNHEMRATGGFIGSYGLLEMNQGKIKKFFIDGIFNPDGQLQEKIVPPVPIQKISAAWSLHDSNWFADFPTSAQKANLFYEKTGGPTVDGVIAITPVVLQRLLAITGPIELENYGATIDENNFMEKLQYEVEVDYDKEENKPKKILSDLAPIILQKVFSAEDPKVMLKAVAVFAKQLSEKHILLYSNNSDLQKLISQQGWSGELIQTNKDYLSVVNSNINGYKTDGVVDETIKHSAQINEDGSITDKVSITRKHNGGNTPYEWWNKVNADYLRIYVPLGSELLSVKGQTMETVEAQLDYKALNFKHDPDVEKIENIALTDQNTATTITQENGKTVFGNWTYVSPGEEVTIEYEYRLPFKLFSVSVNGKENIDTYSLLMQKQSGSIGSHFSSTLTKPASYNLKWNSGNFNSLTFTKDLTTDAFVGAVFQK